jgi:hypothetical protein
MNYESFKEAGINKRETEQVDGKLDIIWCEVDPSYLFLVS